MGANAGLARIVEEILPESSMVKLTLAKKLDFEKGAG